MIYMLLPPSFDSTIPWTISEGPEFRTSAGPRVGLPLPSVPLLTGHSAIVDVKNSNWKLLKLDSSEVSFSEFDGKVIFLNLWGTWCQPCVWEMPYLQDLYDSVNREHVAFLAVSDEPLSLLRSFAAKESLTIPIYQSVSQKPPGFEIGPRPATLLIDKVGRVVVREIGAAAWSDPRVIRLVRSLHE